MGEEEELGLWCDPFDPCGYLVIIIIYVFMMAFWLNDKRINHNSIPTVGITKYWNRCICILTGTEGAIECQEQVAFWRVVFYSLGVHRYHLGLSVKQLKQVFHACALVLLLQRIRSPQPNREGTEDA